MSKAQTTQRLDKWLWHARFFKTRTTCAKRIGAGHVRVNSVKVSRAAYAIAIGDVLTFAQADTIRVVQIIALGTRRGPAPEAQALYEDLSEPAPPRAAPRKAPGNDGKGRRPGKKDRRDIARLKRSGTDWTQR